MTHRFLTTLIAALGLLMLAACPGQQSGSGTGKAQGNFNPANANVPPSKALYPHYLDRPYTDIHEDARQAWFLVEVSYLVIKDKYDRAQQLKESADAAERAEGQQLYNEVVGEVQTVIFGTNATVEQLFQSAIAAEPDNPLNYASYAVYLKPRKRYSSDTQYVDTEQEAIENIDKAIELWPDEPRFYYMKIYTLSEPHQAHEWIRSQGMEVDAIRTRLKEISDIYDELEKRDPENSFVNYSRALFLARIYSPEFGDEPIREMIRELRKGNAKPEGWFYYPPPLAPRVHDASHPMVYAEQEGPVYVDLWLHWGNLDPFAVNQLVRLVDGTSTWPQDKKDIGEVMYMLYALGRLEPFDRTFFNLQLKCLHRQQEAQNPASEEASQLAAATRFLNDQYLDISNQLYKDKLIRDETRFGVLAIEDLETSSLSGQKYMAKYMQGPQAAYLKRAGEILGLDFPLPEDPTKW
ncbi:hypothetical protein KDL44_08360 [bacterium]|nr:hypothetical protein [bacterium]